MLATVPALLLRGATLIDALSPPRPDTDVLVVEGRIAAVGHDLEAPEGADVVDVAGRYVLPGLVDAHVHLMNVPGEPYLELDRDAHDAMLRHQLRSYLACGVTTVLDAATVHERMARIRGWIEEGAPAPRVVTLGRPLGPAGGYPEIVDSALPGVGTRDEIARALDDVSAFGAAGTKVTFEGGFADPWPTFGPELQATIREEALARGLPVFVHAMTPADFVAAMNLRPRAFVHGPERPDRETTRAIAASGAWVVTTLTVYDAPLVAKDEDRLADPLLRIAVPPEQVAAADDPRTVNRARADIAAFAVPWAPRWLVGVDVLARTIARGKQRKALRAAADLHEAGVPLVLGTDSGTWPFIHTQFHGRAAIRELELLGEAGLTPREAIAAGTIVPARLLGLDGEIGSITPGKVADLVVLEADPLADLQAFRRVALTVRAGEARTPEEWIAR